MNPTEVEETVPVHVERQAHVLLVTLDRRQVLNAVDPESHHGLVQAWNRLRNDPELHVGILTGTGTKAFCAGIDLKRLDDFYAESRPGERRERWTREPGIGGLTRNFDPGKPIIAAINGCCLGLGLEMALACDIRLASPNATFGLPEVRWGIIPGQGGTQRLPRMVAPNLALEMILSGAVISADRAHEIGLINRVVAQRRLLPEARLLAERIAALPVRAVRHAREAVRRGLDLPLTDALQLEQDLADPLRGSAESRAARSKFGREHRPKRSERVTPGN